MDKIHRTTDYSKFRISKENRNIDTTKPSVKRLRKSMQIYGWLIAFPMMCRENGDGLVIVDGQHRFTVARELGIPVRYAIDETDVDVSWVNQAQESWKPVDYLNRWVKAGKKDYMEVAELREYYPNVPLGMCAGLLAGTYSFGNVRDRFESGEYKVKTKGLAYRIANAYEKIIAINKEARSSNFLKALYACYYVDDFDPDRLIDSCQKRPHMIQGFSKLNDCLELIEEIYNYSLKSGRIPIKFQAQEAMRKRSAAKQ